MLFPKELNPRHLEIARLRALGLKQKDIAEKVGMSASRISTLLKWPELRLEINLFFDQLTDQAYDRFFNSIDELSGNDQFPVRLSKQHMAIAYYIGTGASASLVGTLVSMSTAEVKQLLEWPRLQTVIEMIRDQEIQRLQNTNHENI